MPFSTFRKSRMLAAALLAGSIGLGCGLAIASQPDMEGALHALQSAQAHLERVTQNKAGHAAAARRLVAKAINEVEVGIQFGRDHGE